LAVFAFSAASGQEGYGKGEDGDTYGCIHRDMWVKKY
jgi:hypothetical protein